MAESNVKCVYVLHGSDAYLRDTHRREVLAEVLGDADPQLCVSTFDADADLAVVLDELRTLPFLAPCRVVVIDDADAFISAHREALEKYLEAPAATSSLVLITTAWNRAHRISKLVEKVGKAVDCSLPERAGLGSWISAAAGKQGKTIAPDAAARLGEYVGRDLAAINQEIAKLAAYVGDRKAITSQDVAAVVASTAGAGAFDLTNALTDGNVRAALDALAGSLNRRGEEFRVLGILASHVRRALLAQQYVATGRRAEEVLPPRIPPQAKNAFLGMLRRRNLRKLQLDMRRLLAADLAMKSGADPLTTMETLVVAMCS